MTVIWKFPLRPDINDIRVPSGTRPLCVQVQSGSPMLWALVNPNEESMENLRVYFLATGEQFNDEGLGYIGTVQLGPLVFHAFADLEIPF